MNQQPDDPDARQEPATDKPWWESKGVTGGIGTITSAAGGLLAMATGHAEFDPVLAMTLVGALATGALGLWGRITAATRITRRGRPART